MMENLLWFFYDVNSCLTHVFLARLCICRVRWQENYTLQHHSSQFPRIWYSFYQLFKPEKHVLDKVFRNFVSLWMLAPGPENLDFAPFCLKMLKTPCLYHLYWHVCTKYEGRKTIWIFSNVNCTNDSTCSENDKKTLAPQGPKNHICGSDFVRP